jgi:hypothetical protein
VGIRLERDIAVHAIIVVGACTAVYHIGMYAEVYIFADVETGKVGIHVCIDNRDNIYTYTCEDTQIAPATVTVFTFFEQIL